MKRLIKNTFLILFVMCTFLQSLPIAIAGTIGVISGDEVNLRERATTNSNSITKLSTGTQVEVISDNPVTGTGCNNGWININNSAWSPERPGNTIRGRACGEEV